MAEANEKARRVDLGFSGGQVLAASLAGQATRDAQWPDRIAELLELR